MEGRGINDEDVDILGEDVSAVRAVQEHNVVSATNQRDSDETEDGKDVADADEKEEEDTFSMVGAAKSVPLGTCDLPKLSSFCCFSKLQLF